MSCQIIQEKASEGLSKSWYFTIHNSLKFKVRCDLGNSNNDINKFLEKLYWIKEETQLSMVYTDHQMVY